MSDINLISARGIYGTVTEDQVLAQSTKAVWCSAGGDLSFVGAEQEDTTVLPGLPANQWVIVNAKKINAASTATVALALFHCCK